jgi:hypothetical protein
VLEAEVVSQGGNEERVEGKRGEKMVRGNVRNRDITRSVGA